MKCKNILKGIKKVCSLARKNKTFLILFLVLNLHVITLNSANAARLDGIGNKTTTLTGNATVSSNIQNISNSSSTDTIINGGGFSINGSNFTGNNSSGAWLRYTSSFTGTGLHNQILNVGNFELTPLLGSVTDETIIKLDDNNEAVRYAITENGSIYGFTTTGGTKGGSFLYSGDKLTIDNTVIKGNKNTAKNTNSKGGAVFYGNNDSDGSGFTISNSYITENYREWLTSSSSVLGGAIFSQQKNGVFNISNSYFTKNYVNANPSSTSSYAAAGGAIANDSGRLEIDGSYFGGNYVSGAKSQGGAIWANGYTPEAGIEFKPHTFNKTVFENNYVTGARSEASGGAIYVLNDANIANSLFLSNKAIINPSAANTSATHARGGAIYKGDNVIGDLASNPNLKFNATLNVSDTTFKDNQILFNDGAVAIREGSSAAGGALYLSNSISNIDKTVFSGNKVVNNYLSSDVMAAGGAIATNSASGDRKGKHFITANFDNNSVTSEGTAIGGAIAALDVKTTSNIVTVNLENSRITNNSAESKGSVANTGAMGGAIYTGTLNFVNLNSSVVDSNTSISSASGTGEAKFGGGAAYVADRGILTAVDTSFTNNKAIGGAVSGGAIYNEKGGTVNIIANNNSVIFDGNMAGNDKNAIHNAGGTLNLNSADGKEIIFNDKITSTKDAVLTINKKGTWNKETWPYSNRIPNDAPNGENGSKAGTIVLNDNMEGYTGSVDIFGGTLKVGKDGTFFNNAKSFNVNNASTLNLANGVVQTHNFGNFKLGGTLDVSLDADAQLGVMDNFKASSVSVENDSKINIQNINLLTSTFTGDSIDLILSDNEELMDVITLDDSAKIALGDVFKYDVDLDSENNSLSITKRGGPTGGNNGTNPTPPVYDNYNPAIMVAPVASQIGYATQLNAYDNAFQNTISKMMQPKILRHASGKQNQYALAENNSGNKILFEDETSTSWFRPYTSFESIDFKNGPDVDNIMYGTFIGTDSKTFLLKNGKRAELSGYLAYNGSHQSFDGNSLYQNGGTIGATASLYKDNFFTALTANAGASAVIASTMFGNDKFPMFMTGVASKSGYNMEFLGGKFVLQPNLLLSYSLVNAFDYTNARGLDIESDPLHAIQVAPGIRLFANSESGWQPYLSADMRWNILDDTKFTAADIALPELSIKPYVEYGLGIQKNTGDNVYGYLQALIRNGGRTGVVLSGGFDFLLGKSHRMPVYFPHM